jgi:hypothetical protein
MTKLASCGYFVVSAKQGHGLVAQQIARVLPANQELSFQDHPRKITSTNTCPDNDLGVQSERKFKQQLTQE